MSERFQFRSHPVVVNCSEGRECSLIAFRLLTSEHRVPCGTLSLFHLFGLLLDFMLVDWWHLESRHEQHLGLLTSRSVGSFSSSVEGALSALFETLLTLVPLVLSSSIFLHDLVFQLLEIFSEELLSGSFVLFLSLVSTFVIGLSLHGKVVLRLLLDFR